MAAIFQEMINCFISVTVGLILIKFSTVMHRAAPSLVGYQKLEILTIQDVRRQTS